MSKFNAGDLVEFTPGNYEIQENGRSFWTEGSGIIMDIENEQYVILIFSLQKISTKNFSEYNIGQKILKIPVEECDRQNCLRSIEI
jgi:hypothetical protein